MNCFHIISFSFRIESDLWEFLDTLDEEDTDVIVLAELVTWYVGELMKIGQHFQLTEILRKLD